MLYEVPRYRRESGALVILLAIVFTPVTLAPCVIAPTGDGSGDAYDKDRNFRVWGFGNKVAAVLIVRSRPADTRSELDIRRRDILPSDL